EGEGGDAAGGVPAGQEDVAAGQDGEAGGGGGAPGEENPYAKEPAYGSGDDPFAPEGGGAGAGPEAATTGDRRAEIDRRLEDTFGAFDTAVRTAQEQIARERAQQGAAGAGGGIGDPFGGEEQVDAAGEGAGGGRRPGMESVGAGGEGEDEGQDEGEGGSQGGGAGVGGSTGSGPREIPADIPDGSDDDVVARQIREAAMAETDPELRAALWEEYRRYKKGQ
ncbi:MAG: hypothetical protein ACO21O_07375, partial [Steroidobacteraceae bacterium]